VKDTESVNNKKRKITMSKEMTTEHADALIKGSALGILTYVGMQFDVNAEVISLAVPLVAVALSWVSTKIGDKNTALLLNLAVKAIEKAPAKKAPVKKTVKPKGK
jgi:hypothetical protein